MSRRVLRIGPPASGFALPGSTITCHPEAVTRQMRSSWKSSRLITPASETPDELGLF